MKKTLFIVITVLLAGTAALAQEQERKPGPRIAQWLKGLQQKIALIAPKKVIPVTTGVAGVRGSKEDAHVKLYWKGKKSEEAVTEEELSEFKQGVECAEKGDSETAVKKLEQFMKQFPDSALIPDAKKTLDIVKAEPAITEEKVEIPEKKEEQADEEKTEEQPEKK